jgi:hypothetical protein
MDRAQILEDLGTKYELPVDAMEAARQQLDALAPTFIDLLERAAKGEELSEEDGQCIFFGVHLLGEADDVRLYRPLCRFIRQAPDVAAWEFDAALVDTVPGILINVADDDPAPLLELARQTDIEYPTGDAIRAMAVGAYAYLVAIGWFDRAAAQGNLVQIAESFESDVDMSSAHAWIVAAIALGLPDLVERGREMMRDEIPGAEVMTVEEIDELVEKAQRMPAEAILADEGFEPFHDTITTMAGWEGFSPEGVQERINARDDPEADAWLDEGLLEEDVLDEDTFYEAGRPAGGTGRGMPGGPVRQTQSVNPYRDVGRNDPCPCGSGKKYKKCCLQ